MFPKVCGGMVLVEASKEKACTEIYKEFFGLCSPGNRGTPKKKNLEEYINSFYFKCSPSVPLDKCANWFRDGCSPSSFSMFPDKNFRPGAVRACGESAARSTQHGGTERIV